MNLPYTHSLLLAASEQRHGFIRLEGATADHEVRQMAAAGLVDATFYDGTPGSFTSINRLRPAGETFLRAFKQKPLPKVGDVAAQTASHLATVAKWRAKLAA